MELYLYLGPEEFKKREAIEKSLREKKRKLSDLKKFHASSVNLEEVWELLSTVPLFGGGFPSIVISDINLLTAKQQKRLTEICTIAKNLQNDAQLFLLSKEYKIGAGLAQVFPKPAQRIFWEQSESEKKKYIRDFVRRNQFQIEEGAVELLFEKISRDLLVLEKSLETVFLYMHGTDARSITEEELQQIFFQSRDVTVFDLFHYLSARDLAHSLIVAESLLLRGSDKPIGLLLVLMKQWNQLLRFKERLQFDSFEKICADESIKTKALKANLRVGADRYNLRELLNIQKLNYDYSVKLKLGGALQNILFQHYIYCCVQEIAEF